MLAGRFSASRAWLLATAVLLPLGFALGRMSAPAVEREAATPLSPVLARFEGGVITEEEFLTAFERVPPAERTRFLDEKGRAQLLQSILRQRLLARAAREEGLEQLPELREAFDRALADRLLARRFDADEIAATLSPDELRAHYQENLESYRRAERARASIIVALAAPTEPAKLQAKRELLEKVRAELVLRDRNDPSAFVQLARARSEDPLSRSAGGDLGVLTRADVETRLGPALAVALFETLAPGEISTVLPTRSGAALVKLHHREAAQILTFEEAQHVIRSRLGMEKRRRLVEQHVLSLSKKYDVEVFADRLSRLALQPPARM